MASKSHHEDGHHEVLKNPEVNYELIDTNIGAVLKIGLIFVVLAVIGPFILNFLYAIMFPTSKWYLGPKETVVPVTARPSNAAGQKKRLDTEPMLQGVKREGVDKETTRVSNLTPPKEMKEWRAAEMDRLSHYGWVNQEKGVVRVPIDQAMEMMLKKGYPVKVSPIGLPASGDPNEKSNQPASSAQPEKKDATPASTAPGQSAGKPGEVKDGKTTPPKPLSENAKKQQ